MSYTYSKNFKTHLFNIKFSIKSLEAICQRTSCKVHISIKIQNQQRKLKDCAEIKKNIAIFNSDLLWQSVALKYDQISGTYIDYIALISIHYQTSQQGSRNNKLKIGQVSLNLAKLLNTKTYRINNQYNVQKCYDANAKLKLSIDLTQIQENYNTRVQTETGQINQNSIWKVSKIRQKMNEDQKVLLQNKIFEYEERIQKHREGYNDQIKKLAEQMQRKQQKISTLVAQNNSLIQAIQSNQIQSQKHKSKISNLQKQLINLQQSLRTTNITKQSLSRQLNSKNQQIQLHLITIQQLQQTKDKKQQHYKHELQKYMQKYMQSQNARNRIIFQLENKMKEQIQKKQQYYAEIISKLQSRLQNTGHSSKQILVKKEKQIIIIQQKYQKNQKQRSKYQAQCQQYQLNITQLNEQINNLSTQLQKSQQTLKSIQSQSQLSAFSASNLQRQFQKLKSEQKLFQKTIDQNKYEIELANKTIEQQQAMIVKLNRNIKMHKQRQYYMQQKYQDQLQIKTYNQQCMVGTNNYYKGLIKKMQIKIKFLQQKIQDNQSILQNTQKQKQKLQQQLKNINRILFQNGHQIIRLQNQNKKINQHIQQIQFENNQKQIINKQLQQKLNNYMIQHQQQINSYIITINQLQNKVRQITQKMNNNTNQWQQQFNSQILQKNNILMQIQKQVQKLKRLQNQLKIQLKQIQQRKNQLQNQLQLQKQKIRIYQRQALKTKFQISKLIDQRDSLIKQQNKYKNITNQQKNQIFSLKNQNQKLTKKNIKQKQSYVQLIKWIFDRNWDSTTRQFVQQAGYQIQLELISFINTGLQRIYGFWQKNIKALQQTRQQNQRILQKLNHHNLQLKYQQQFGKEHKLKIIKNQIEMIQNENLWEQNIFQQKTYTPTFQPISDFTTSHDSLRVQQLRSTNYQLQRDLSSKITQIQTLNQQLFQQKTKIRELTEQNRNLKQDVEDLNLVISKKSSIITNLQTQISQRESDVPNFSSSYAPRSPGRAVDYKVEAESKFKQQKIMAEFQRKFQELDRQNSLQKSKIQLLQSRLKASNEKNLSDTQKIILLEKNLKQKEEISKNLLKDNQIKQNYLQKLKAQLDISNSKSNKKDRLIQELKIQLEQQKKITQILSKQVEDWQKKYIKRQKQLQKQVNQNQKILLQATEGLAIQKMEKEKLNLEQGSQIINLKTSLKQTQRRIVSLQSLLQKSKQENQVLYQKHLKLLNSFSEAEENIKDLKMNEMLGKQNYEKSLADLMEKIQNKQFEFEQLKFKLESKIMDLEKQLEEKLIIQL